MVDSIVRITVPTVKVLRLLLDEPKTAVWGLEIVKKTGLLTGTVYPIMDRLETLGWVSSEWEPDNDRNGPRRRYYRIRPEAVEEAERTLSKYDTAKGQRDEQTDKAKKDHRLKGGAAKGRIAKAR